MLYSIARTPEQGYREREIFYDKHGDQTGWKHKKWTPSLEQTHRLSTLWSLLINTQNGQDTDDYLLLPGSNKIEQLVQFLSNKELKILVLGTGTGREVALLKELGYKNSWGTTLGPRNIKFAQDIVGLDKEDLIFNDHHFLDLPNQSFDIIVGSQVIEHTPAPLFLLFECNRLLAEGGTIFLETPCPVLHTGDSNLHHILCPLPFQLRGLLVKSGFGSPLFYTENKGQTILLSSEDESRSDLGYTAIAKKEKEPDVITRGY